MKRRPIPTTRWRTRALAAALAGTSACGHYQPALFADRPVVNAARDDVPIGVPARSSFDERVQVSDIYLRRPLFDVVHPLDFATAGDVNAMDEVPTSTWYDPDGATRKGMPEVRSAPPTLPVVVVDEKPSTNDAALVVRDARGLRFELLGDPPGQAGLFTGAEVLGGYLLRSLGLNAPMARIVDVPESAIAGDGEKSAVRLRSWSKDLGAPVGGLRRVSATLWPGGIDVGVASDFSVRRDDPNDKVDHNDRRTLRAMKVFGHWIGWTHFGVRRTRDVYVGKAGEGHLVHYVVGASRAFGTEELREHPIRDERGGSLWWNLVTLGLSPTVIRGERDSGFPSLGYLPSSVDPAGYDVSPPYSPFVRFTPADEYWAGKRLVDAGDDALRAGVAEARLPEEAARHLLKVLRRRRHLLVVHAMSVVSPLDAAGTSGRLVLLRDRAIAAGLAAPLSTRYDVQFLDNHGGELPGRARLDAVGAMTGVPLPDGTSGRVVLHIRVIRAGSEAPRACDVHLVVKGQSARIIGVRH